MTCIPIMLRWMVSIIPIFVWAGKLCWRIQWIVSYRPTLFLSGFSPKHLVVRWGFSNYRHCRVSLIGMSCLPTRTNVCRYNDKGLWHCWKSWKVCMVNGVLFHPPFVVLVDLVQRTVVTFSRWTHSRKILKYLEIWDRFYRKSFCVGQLKRRDI